MASKPEIDPSSARDSPMNGSGSTGLNLSALFHECPVCFHELDDPKVLHCGHNLCSKCLRRIAESTRPVSIACPECRRITLVDGGIAEIPTNFALKKTISTLKELCGPTIINCSDCLKEIPREKALVCTSVICGSSRTRRITYDDGDFDDIDLWEMPKLCDRCANRIHRDHGPFQKMEDLVKSEEKGKILNLEELTEENQITGLVRKIRKARIELEELYNRAWLSAGDAVIDPLSKVKAENRDLLVGLAGVLKNPRQPITKEALERTTQSLEALIKKAKSFIANDDLLKSMLEEFKDRLLEAYNDPTGAMLKLPGVPPPPSPIDDDLPGQKGKILRYLREINSFFTEGIRSEQIRLAVDGDENFQADIQALLDEAYIFQTYGNDIYAAI